MFQNGNWLLTASRDHLLKLFDIRNTKEEVQTFRGHKKEASTVAWHPGWISPKYFLLLQSNNCWTKFFFARIQLNHPILVYYSLAQFSRQQICDGETHSCQVHEGLFASGGSDGAIMFWNVGEDKESGVIENAHESIVWSLAWHPIGHILCSGSNDHTAKFWEVLINHSFVTFAFPLLHFINRPNIHVGLSNMVG